MGVTGTFLGTAAQGVWSTARLDFSAPWGGVAKLHFGAFGGSISRAGAAVGRHGGPVQHADQGQRLRGRVGLRDGPAGRLAGPHGQRGLRPAAAQRHELHGRFHDGRGRLGRNLLRSADVHRRRVRDVRRRRVAQLAEHGGGLLSSATGITGSTLTVNNGQRQNFTTVGDVSTGALTASGTATAASFAAAGALTRGPARAWTAPSRPRAAGCRRAGLRRRDELGHGLRDEDVAATQAQDSQSGMKRMRFVVVEAEEQDLKQEATQPLLSLLQALMQIPPSTDALVTARLSELMTNSFGVFQVEPKVVDARLPGLLQTSFHVEPVDPGRFP